MAQNSTKGLKAKAASGGRKKNGITKKGQRNVAPKEKVRVMQAAAQKKLSSSINSSIERQMVQAASAGKLTIMKGAGGPAGDGKGKAKAK